MDRPIIFSGPMVRAIIDGRKSQTRRVAKVKPGILIQEIDEWKPCEDGLSRRAVFTRDQIAAPRFAVGDRLWVRETLQDASNDQGARWLAYAADGKDVWPLTEWHKVRDSVPSIHMPRWASRLTLTVTDVRVERLQQISEADAIAEGMSGEFCDYELYGQSKPYRYEFCGLWDSLNAARGYGWDVNPWIVAVTFTVERRNIDAEAA